jgi:hypothetical protein
VQSPPRENRFSSQRVSENPFTVATDDEDYGIKQQRTIISPKNKRRADSEKGWNRGSSSGIKAAGPASGESPPTFIKGISSQTKYSAGSNFKSFMPEGAQVLQEVKEQTIQEEEYDNTIQPRVPRTL